MGMEDMRLGPRPGVTPLILQMSLRDRLLEDLHHSSRVLHESKELKQWFEDKGNERPEESNVKALEVRYESKTNDA